MEAIAWLAILLITSSLFMIAYVVVTNHFAARKLKEEID